MDRGAWKAHGSPWGGKESDTTDWLTYILQPINNITPFFLVRKLTKHSTSGISSKSPTHLSSWPVSKSIPSLPLYKHFTPRCGKGLNAWMGWTSTYNQSITIIPLLPLNCDKIKDRDYYQHLTHTVSTLHTQTAPYTYSQHSTHTVTIPHIQSASHTIPITLQPPNKWLPNG